MGVNNFKPTLWAPKILKELDKEHMLVKNCSTDYSGQISGLGSKVKINSINTPTIGDYVPNSTTITPEQLKDESRMLEITQAKYFSFYLDDIDEKQATKGLLEEGLRKAVIGLKDTAEQFIAGKYTDAYTTITEASLTSENVLSTITKGLRALRETGNVGDGVEKVLEVTPDVYYKLVLANILYNNQDNGETLRKGVYSPVLGVKIFMSNNLSFSRSTAEIATSYCLLRTKEAIGYAEQIMKTEKYMPESSFSEAIKGLHVYGAKVLKPKEMVCFALTTAAESTSL